MTSKLGENQFEISSFYRSIGANDKLILNRTIKSIELRRKKLSEARQALYRAGQQKLREKITGDRNKRIRDHMKEVPQVGWHWKCSKNRVVLSPCIFRSN